MSCCCVVVLVAKKRGEKTPASDRADRAPIVSPANDQSPISLSHDMPNLLHSKFKFSVTKNEFVFQFLAALNPIFQVQANPPTTTVGGEFYTLIQYHFHTPAEHPVDDVIYPLESHFVFGSESGATLALGFLFKFTDGKSHWLVRDALTKTTTKVPQVDSDFFVYTGSLTTPPTDTNINWQLWDSTFCVNKRDLLQLVDNGMVQNARPVQDRNGRLVGLTRE